MSYNDFGGRSMDKKNYRPRLIDKRIDEYLRAFGALCIEGPKWCGKTWTSMYHSQSEILLGAPEGNFQNRRLAEISPALVLEGEKPRLLDEWQEVPTLWDAVRYAVDKTGEKGQFIMTGSATPNHKGIMHSGAGRIAKLRMRPMSLYEAGFSSGDISLQQLCKGNLTAKLTGDISLNRIIEYIIRGGWPGSLDLPLEAAALLPREYIKAIIDDDVYRMDGIKRDTIKMKLLLHSLARNESTTVTNKTLKNDIKEKDAEDIDSNTISEYLNIFERLFLIENQKPFAASMRSSVRIKQAEKRHFVDPSIAATLLGATPANLLRDLETLGFLFEALCERDLRIYAEAFGGQLYHYQDYKNREIDAVVQLPDGDWCAFEIKLGANQIDSAAEGLLTLQSEFLADAKSKPPKALCVLCGLTNAAYQRPDGVFVVPLTALRE